MIVKTGSIQKMQAQSCFPVAAFRLARRYSRALAGLAFATAFLAAAPAHAATAPSMGTAQGFAVLGATAISNTGLTSVGGDLGISPNNASSVTGFPPGIVSGTSHYADAVALAAQNDVTAAYNSVASQPCNTTISADLGGSTLVPGVYCSASSMGLTGTLTLDAQGDPSAVFVFQIGSSLTTASGARVNVINGGQNCNVFWQIGSSATFGTGTSVAGNVMALSSITMNTGASASGRILARTGAVSLNGSSVAVCSLAVIPPLIAPTTITTQASPSIALGGQIIDTATLAGGTAPTGSLTFRLFGPGDAACTAAPVFTQTLTLPGGNGSFNSAQYTPLLVGTYRWIANYSGDATNAPSTGLCNDPNENVLVVAASPATPPTVASIPTLNEWAMILLGSLLVLIGLAAIRRLK